MLRFIFPVLCLTISACAPTASDFPLASRSVPVTTTPCEGAARNNCAFINGPVALQTKPVRLFLRKQKFFRTVASLEFVDRQRKKWLAPRQTLTDGATIPELFVPLVGAPQSPNFVNAAALHDAYCGVGNQKLPQYHSDHWQNVHRMFYDALRVGGTSSRKAKIMFAAVYLGGPRWTTPRNSPATSGQPLVGQSQHSPVDLSQPHHPEVALHNPMAFAAIRGDIPNWVMLDEMKMVIAFINTNDPALTEIEAYLIRREIIMLGRIAKRGGDGNGYLSLPARN